MNSSIRIKSILIGFTIFLIIGLCNSALTLVTNPTNGNKYGYSSSAATYSAAVSACAQEPVPAGYSQGYLTTITSEDEAIWVEDNLGIATSAFYWIAGSDLGDTGNWTYNYGPEKGQLQYNLFTDRGYQYVNFGGIEPNLVLNENYIVVEKGKKWNNIVSTANYRYICEFSKLGIPYIPPVPTSGAMVTIDVTGFDIPTLSILFSSSYPFSCEGITAIDLNTVRCWIPPGTGKHQLTFQDKDQTTTPIPWQFYLPYVSLVAPVFEAGQIVTVVGDSFGSDASLISTVLSASGTGVPCTQTTIIKASRMYTCVLSAAIDGATTKFLPIQVTVNTLKSPLSYKAIIYDAASQKMFSAFQTATTFTVNLNEYSDKLRVDGNKGYLATIKTQAIYNFLKKCFSFGSGSVQFAVGLKKENSDLKYLTGPLTNTVIANPSTDLYYANPSYSFPTGVNYAFDFGNGNMVAAGSGIGAISEFGGYDPSVIDSNSNYLIDTSGGTIFVRLLNFGTSLGTTTVAADNLASYTIDYIRGGISITILRVDLASSPYPITITVDGKVPTQAITYDRAAPTITSIEPSLGTAGGTLTIIGTSFSTLNLNFQTSITISGITCTNIEFVTYHKKFTCTLAPGVGQKSVSLAVDGLSTAAAFTYDYQKPTITGTSPIPAVGGIITIEGTNLGNVASDLSITSCSNIEFVTEHTAVKCTVAPGQGAISFSLSQAGYTTPPFNTHYLYPTIDSITQLVEDVEIAGENFGSNPDKMVVKMGTVTVTSYCTLSNDTNILCTELPVVMGPFSVSNDNGGNFGTFNYDLSPYIIGIFAGNCFSLQDKVSMTGTYMVSETEFKLKLDGKYYPVDVINSTTFEFIVPYGSGQASLQLEADNSRLSNIVTFPFCPPVINDSAIVIDPMLSVVEIAGKGFGDDDTDIQGYITSNDDSVQQKLILAFFNNTFIKMVFPEDAFSGWIVLNISSQVSNRVWVDIAPLIQTSTSPLVKGSPITISGKHFKRVDINGDAVEIEFLVNNVALSCEPVDETYVCQAPRGSGNLLIQARSKSLKGTSVITDFSVTYVKPVVVSSTSTVYGRPGLINVTVLYFDPQDINVFVEDEPCTNLVVLNDETVQCLYASNLQPRPNGESLLIKVVTGGASWISNNQVFLYKDEKECPNNCSEHGECYREVGVCLCEDGWTDSDCSLSLGDMVPLPPPNVTKTSLTTLPALKMDFDIAITHLREISGVTKQPVLTIPMKDITWLEVIEKPDTKETYFKGSFDKYPKLEVQVKTQIFEKQGTAEFAGSTVIMQGNSVKYQITISSFPFSSSLNSLQVIYHTKTQNTSTFECQEQSTGHQADDNVAWFKVNSGGVMMNARFSNRVIVDSRIAQISISMLNDTSDTLVSQLNSTGTATDYHILTALTTPFFSNSVTLDPNFGALLKSDPKTECSSSTSNSWKWKGPVIAVSCLIAVGLSVGLIMYYRNRPTINYKMRSFTSKLRSLSRS